MKDVPLSDLISHARDVMDAYSKEFPEVKTDRDYFPFKITEEWGECLQTYLMLTDRGRQKGFSKEDIHRLFSDEIADVFGFLLLFAENEGINIAEALQKKWSFREEKENL